MGSQMTSLVSPFELVRGERSDRGYSLSILSTRNWPAMYERARPRSYSVATFTKNQSSNTRAVTGWESPWQADPLPNVS